MSLILYRSALLFFQPGLGPGFLLALGSSVLASLLFEELTHLKESEIFELFLINLPSIFRNGNSYGLECIRLCTRVNSALMIQLASWKISHLASFTLF